MSKAKDLPAYVASAECLKQRMMLVGGHGEELPKAVALAAMILGARVQEHVWTPALHYEQMGTHRIAFSRAVKRCNKTVAEVAKAVAASEIVVKGVALAAEVALQAAPAGLAPWVTSAARSGLLKAPGAASPPC